MQPAPRPRGRPPPPGPLRLMLLVHGYPPRERAGTEEHARQVAEALAERGHAVRVLAATRAPGRPQYSRLEDPPRPGRPSVGRIVQNLPARPLRAAERDAAVDQWLREEQAAFRPDLLHVHHSQFLSCSAPIRPPWVLSLHDAWAWCAAGGQLVQPDGRACPGPDPARCAPCHAAWRPVPSAWVGGLSRAAGALSPFVAPERLHRLYQRLPSGLRAQAGRGRAGEEGAEAAAARNAGVLAWHRGADLRLAPSAWLAAEATAQGLGPVEVLPHGVAPLPLDPGPRRGLLFLGTIARHKGPDLVVEAWRRAFPDGAVGLALHGPVVEAGAAAGHPVGPVLDRAGVGRALGRAQALVLGSRWAENAPLVILEARQAGCPVVAPASGGIPELVEPGRDGLLYPPGDLGALAEALRAVVAAPPGPARPPPRLDDHVDALLVHYRRLLGEAACASP